MVQRKTHVLRKERHDAFRERPPVQHRCNRRRAVALVDQGHHLAQRQCDGLAPVRKHNRCGGMRLVNRHHDVAVRDQRLHLKGVHLAKANCALQKDEHRVIRLVIGHRCRRKGMGFHIFQRPKNEGRPTLKPGQGVGQGSGVLQVGRAG